MLLTRPPRWYDILLALFFLCFVVVNATVEAPTCLGAPVTPDSPHYMLRESYTWCLRADRLFIAMPLWVRTATCIHAFFFGPFYFLFAVALLLKISAVRIPALIVCGMKLYAGALYIVGNLYDEQHAPAEPKLFLLQSSSYMLIPLLMMIRMIPSRPFAAKNKASKRD